MFAIMLGHGTDASREAFFAFKLFFNQASKARNRDPMHVEKVAWGGLTSYVVHELATGKQPRLAVVLCHGFGAGGADLVGLARPLLAADPTVAGQVVFIFPAAPLDLTEHGMPGGRAWWLIDLDRLINRPTPELLERFRRASPAGLEESGALLLSLMDEAGEKLGLMADHFVLGGFSQGAMLATDVALRLPKGPAALCVLSGALINEDEWRKLALARGPLTVVQSHGRNDSILPFPMASALRDLLLDAGAEVDFLAFAGDHEIPPEAVERIAMLLTRLLAN
jgi:phospholipase/carboxylesterase